MKESWIMRHVPKNKCCSVSEAWEDSDGIWIILMEGWNADGMDYPCRTIHCWSVEELDYQIAQIRKLN